MGQTILYRVCRWLGGGCGLLGLFCDWLYIGFDRLVCVTLRELCALWGGVCIQTCNDLPDFGLFSLFVVCCWVDFGLSCVVGTVLQLFVVFFRLCSILLLVGFCLRVWF